MAWFKGCVLAVLVIVEVQGQNRNPPGVNPSHYQQQPPGGGHPPPPPQQFQGQPPQQQFQQQQQQFQGQPPPQQFQGQPPPQQFQGQPQQQFQGQPPQQQQFQGQPPPQQFQGQPPQQVPQQQRQGGPPPPPQQQQQQQRQPPPPPQQQQGKAQHGHGHGHHAPGQQKVLHKDIKHEAEHMKEHMEVPIDTSNMSEQELQFHYFKMHDSDGNDKLDGCELVKSLIHWHDASNHDHKAGPVPEAKIFQDNELINMIDPILDADDKNKDGFIDYPEFIAAQTAAASV